MRYFCGFWLIAITSTLSACANQSVWAPDEVVQKAHYTSSEPAYLVLKTIINNSSGSGGHSALTINASQTVMYDPAGRWSHSLAPERNDMVFGISPKVEENYDLWHARDTHHVVNQKIYVSESVAEKALRLTMAAGSSLDAQCALNISGLLMQLEGFSSLKSTYFPANLKKQFANLPGVQTTRVFKKNDKN